MVTVTSAVLDPNPEPVKVTDVAGAESEAGETDCRAGVTLESYKKSQKAARQSTGTPTLLE